MQTIKFEGYLIQTAAQGNLSRIALERGGEVPEALSGLWTTPDVAMRAVTGYKAKLAAIELNKKPAKVQTKAPSTKTSTVKE